MAFALAACGGSSDSSSSGGGTSETSSSEGGQTASGFDPAPFEAIANPTKGPWEFPDIPKGPTNKHSGKLAAISCPLEFEGCNTLAEGVKAAGETLGFEVIILNTEGKPAKIVSSFEQAKQLGVEGIFVLSLDPSTSEPYIASAREEGVPVVGIGQGGRNYNLHPSPTGLSAEYNREEPKLGEISAANVVLHTEGKTKLLYLKYPEEETVVKEELGFNKIFSQCSECEIADTIQFSGADITTSLPAQVKAKLTANPDINAVWVGSDAFLVAVNPAIESLGVEGVHTYAIDGQVSAIENISEGGVQETTQSGPPGWMAWAATDQMDRVINGVKPVTINQIPFMTVEPENVSKFDNEFHVPIDYPAEYKKLWGVK